MKYHDKIYALGAPFACQHDEAYVLFYNKAIREELGLESPYDLYVRDEWTMSKLLEYCKAAKSDLNGDGVFDGNDRYGFVCGNEFDGPFVLYMGAGGRFLTEVEDGHFEFSLNTKDAYRLINPYLEYTCVRIDSACDSLRFSMAADRDCMVEIRLDAVDGELLATLAVPGGDSPQTVQADIEKVADRHNVYLVIPEKGRKLVFE